MIPVELIFEDGQAKRYLLPQSFEELTQDQFIKVVTIMKRSELNPSDQWLLLLALTKISRKDLETLNAVQRVELLSTMSFLYGVEHLPSKQMIKKLYTSPKGKGKASVTLHGPGDLLKYLTFGEFLAAETKLDRFNASRDQTALNQFCGILYRRSAAGRKEHSDPRAPFDEGLVESYGRCFEGSDISIQTALLLNYHGMKRRFAALYQNVFPQVLQDEDPEADQPQAKQKVPSSMAWLNTLVRMADRDVTKIKQIETSPLHTVLKVLDDLIQHNEDMKNEALRNRR